MQAKVISFRRGRHTYAPRHFILQAEGIGKKAEAEKLAGRQVVWKSPSGKEINGKIASTHGNKGLLRAVFEKGLPGQAINTKVEIK